RGGPKDARCWAGRGAGRALRRPGGARCPEGTMTDRDALLRAIDANPEEDTPRLAFADWLDEHAGAGVAGRRARAWAAFVRDQVEFARLTEADARYRDLRPRFPSTPPPAALSILPRPLRRGAQFVRGFPELLRISARQFLATGGELAAAPGPLVALKLSHAGPHVHELVGERALARFRALEFSHSRFTDDGF